MKKNKSFLNGILLSSVLILLLTLSITENTFQKAFNGKLQQAAAINSVSVENIYNISPSKDVPGMFDFNYAFEKTPSFKKGEKAFDLPIAIFDDEKARAILEKEYGMSYVDFGPIRDAWNYPVKPNAFMKADEKKESTKKQSFLNSLKTNKAFAMDEDTDNPGVYNCRANTSVTGYFKAYFEDVALGTNIGYDDPTYGEGRREEVCRVLEDMSVLLMINGTNTQPDILFMRSDISLPQGALAGASSYSGYYSLNPDNGSLHKHILTREDPTPTPGNFDALVITNFNGVNWDVDSSLNSSTYDMYSVMWHEMLHALGFENKLSVIPPGQEFELPYTTLDYFSYKDNSLLNSFINHVTKLLNVPVGVPSPWFLTNQVVYQGVKNIVGANPDEVRSVYSPSSWQQGSSLSHFDMNRDGQTYVMHPSIGTNTEREIHQGEKEVLCHLGYMVSSITPCQYATPVAVDDLITFDGVNPVCVDPIANDPFMLVGNMYLYDIFESNVYPGDSFEYYSSIDCTGLSTSEPYNRRSILFTPGESTEPRDIVYRMYSSTGNRVSFPANIHLGYLQTCDQVTTDPDEYICNGGFDAVIPSPHNSSFAQIYCIEWGQQNYSDYGGEALNLCQFFNTPDVVLHDSFSGYGSYTAPAPEGTDFPYLRGIINSASETPIMKLKEPLVSGNSYKLSFDFASKTSAIDISKIKFALLLDASTGNPLVQIPEPHQMIFNQTGSSVSPQEWYSFEETFTADESYEYVIFYVEDEGSIGVNWILFDNISIRPADAPPPPPNLTGSITGTIYQDLNQNGLQSSNESSLSGISVSLFEQGNNTPLQTVTSQNIPNLGKYTFNNLPDGTYYVALQGEDIYPSITEPQTNNLLSGYSHARQVTVSNGQISENNNFGVGLNNASTNIGIKKDLIDSQISLFDRYITWRVLVYNTGPGLGTNIRIGDILPEDINYHIQNSQNNNITYNQNEGVITVTSLEPNTYTYVDITTRVPKRACGRKTNVATLISLDQDDTNSQDNSASKTFVLDPCPKPGGDFPAVVK
ncbi:MAG: SdrD B-like domain-containing protein [Candidatus Paceibacterota bacterium]